MHSTSTDARSARLIRDLGTFELTTATDRKDYLPLDSLVARVPSCRQPKASTTNGDLTRRRFAHHEWKYFLHDFADRDVRLTMATALGTDRTLGTSILRIVIPAKNEEARIGATVLALSEYFGSRATVLVVANACTDRTCDIVREIGKSYQTVQLLEIAAPIGKGGAVRAGLKIGHEPYLAFVDADGSTRPDQVQVLLDRCQSEALDGAIGSRWLPGSIIKRRQPFRRRVASRTFNMLVRLMFGLPYTDTQCGAKVFSRTSIDRALGRLEIANFAFDVDLLVALRRLRCRVIELPIVWDDVPEYSKVALIRSGSSMFVALLRLLVRNSILRHLPWSDLVGRSSAIPVRRGLKFLVLRKDALPTHAQRRLLSAVVDQGHEFDERVVHFPLGVLSFALSYIRAGHRTYDVLIDLLGNEGSPLSGFSTKPKLYPSSVDDLTDQEIAVLVERTARRCGYSAFFWRFEQGWTLSSSRVETLLHDTN